MNYYYRLIINNILLTLIFLPLGAGDRGFPRQPDNNNHNNNNDNTNNPNNTTTTTTTTTKHNNHDNTIKY